MDTLGISTERAVLEIRSEPAKIRISNHRPQFRVRHRRPQMRISRKDPTFKVNWAQLRPHRGQEPAIMYSKKTATKAQQQVMEYIASIAQEGDRMMYPNRETIPQIVRDRLKAEYPELNIGIIPEQQAKVEWDMGYMKIQWDEQVFEIEWDVQQSPSIEVEPYVVEVRLRNRPTVKIWVNRDKDTGQAHTKIDKHI